MKRKNEMKQLMAVLTVFISLIAIADNYNLPAGESDSITSASTYDTMTVGGDLTVGGAGVVTVHTLNVPGGTVTVSGTAAAIGTESSNSADKTAVHLSQDDSGNYGKVIVDGTSATATDKSFCAYQLYVDKEIGSSLYADGYLDFANVTDGGFNTRQIFNNSSLTGRLVVAGSAVSIYRAGGRAAGPIFDTGAFRIEMKDDVALTINVAGQGGYFNKEGTPVEVVGNGTFRVLGTYSTSYPCAFNRGAVMNHHGPIVIGKYSPRSGSLFRFADDDVIGPNVTGISTTDDCNDGVETILEITSGVTLTVCGDIDFSKKGDRLTGGTLRMDATSAVRSFKANINEADTLVLEKLGANDLVFSSTPHLPTLKLHGGAAKFTSDCTIKTLDCSDGGCVIAGNGATVLIESGAAAMTGTLMPPSGVTEWSEGDHVMCYFKGDNPDMTKILAPSIPGKSYSVSIVDGAGEYEGWKALKLTASAVTPVSATWVGAGADDAVTTAENWEGASVLDFDNGSVAATFATDGNRADVAGLAWFNSILFTAAGGFTVRKGDAAATVGLYGDSLLATGAGTYAFEPTVRAFGAANVSVGPEAKLVLGDGIVAENGQVTLTATAAGAEVELRGTNVISGRLHATDSNVKLTLSGLVTNPDGVDTRAATDILGVDVDPKTFAFTGGEARNIYLDNVTMEKAFCATTANSNKGRSLWALANTTNRFCAGGYFYTTWGTVYAERGSQVIFEKDVRSTNGFGKYGDGELTIRGKLTTDEKLFQIRAGTLRVECPGFYAAKIELSSCNTSESEICMLEIATNVLNAGSIELGTQWTGYVECLVKIDAGCEAGFDSVRKFADSQDSKARVVGEDRSVLCMKSASVLDIRMSGGLGVKADCGMDGVVVLTNRDYEATGPLIAQEGVLELDSTASWAGTNLVVRGAGAESYGTLRVTKSDNFLNRRLVGAIEGAGKFDLASNVRLVFDQLTVDGEKVAPGTYTRTSTGMMAGHVTGAGSLYVRGPGLLVVFR